MFQASRVQQEALEQLEAQVSQGIEVHLEILELRVQLEILVLQDNLAHLGHRDLQVIVANRVRLAILVLLDLKGHKDLKGLVETMEIQVKLVMQEHQDLQEIQEEMVRWFFMKLIDFVLTTCIAIRSITLILGVCCTLFFSTHNIVLTIIASSGFQQMGF